VLEIAIIICLAAIFIIVAVRFPKTADLSFLNWKKQLNEDEAILEAKKILNEKTPEELPEIPPAGTEQTDELDIYNDELAELLKSAREKIENGKYASAETILIDAICKENKCAWAYERLGSIYLLMDKNLADASESYLMAVKLDKNNDRAWFGLGKIYFKDGKFSKSIDALSRAVRLSRSNPEYQAMLGKSYMEIRQYGKASKALKRAASLDISNQEYKELASAAEDKHREHSRASKV